MKHLLKNARLEKNIKTRELARLTNIDPALISKFESGERFPTSKQIEILATVLQLPLNELQTNWIKAKILHEFGNHETTIAALKMILSENEETPESNNLDYIFEEIEKLKLKLKKPN